MSQRNYFKVSNQIFLSSWIFFHEHSRFTGKQGKGEASSLTSLCHFHQLQVLRPQLGNYYREFISAHSQQLDSNREPLVSDRKSLTAKPSFCVLKLSFTVIAQIFQCHPKASSASPSRLLENAFPIMPYLTDQFLT